MTTTGVIILVFFFIIYISISIFLIKRLLIKNEEQEEVLESYQIWNKKLHETITYCSNRIKQIDEKEIFASDDEIGWWFEEVKNMQTLLDQYKNENP